MARDSQEGPGEVFWEGKGYIGRDDTLKPRGGKSTRWAEDERGRASLLNEGAGRRSVGGG